uniref:Uncharacterized protein n=2 Tax=Anguilla anguilla TaxID=7936 RepID=A0A0E9PXV2_ANGAN
MGSANRHLSHCLWMSRIVWGISMRERKSQMHENSYYYYPEVFT